MTGRKPARLDNLRSQPIGEHQLTRKHLGPASRPRPLALQELELRNGFLRQFLHGIKYTILISSHWRFFYYKASDSNLRWDGEFELQKSAFKKLLLLLLI
ncbi:hypothetical protein Y032_0296g1712 [Ancylostoma ceylanicum]|uniref:Uncharacterized protein n=1 Tax=Ancylostoma ceylanicum TaxID=53326 RepID=A0A016S5I0_9BILA|nr:hypothetical protein Y032_0296g1712 [Ancylostoma ceylanicum]